MVAVCCGRCAGRAPDRRPHAGLRPLPPGAVDGRVGAAARERIRQSGHAAKPPKGLHPKKKVAHAL